MKLFNYEPHEIRFAFCYRVYFSWQTYRRREILPLADLCRTTLNNLLHAYNVRVLECVTSTNELRCIISLRPTETISVCASKLKGRVSKWLCAELHLPEPQSMLSKGYFACTTGKARTRLVERYLSLQAQHHGYPPRITFVDRYRLSPQDKSRVFPKHAMVIARFHIVISTTGRRRVIGSAQGPRIATEWRKTQQQYEFALIKVSFVPDHVHIAVRTHPSISPATVVAVLMNAAQQVMQEELMQAGLDRLWMNSAYVGSYGGLSSPQIRKYLERLRIGER